MYYKIIMDLISCLENNVRGNAQFNILDLIAINPITDEAYKQIFTDSKGFVRVQYFKTVSFKQMAGIILSSISKDSTSLPEYAMIVSILLN